MVFSSIPKSIRKELERWAEQTGALSFERERGGVRVYVRNQTILQNAIRTVSPQVQTESESLRAINLARFRDTKLGESRHHINYYVGKAQGNSVTAFQNGKSIDLSKVTSLLGCFSIPMSENLDPWQCEFPLLLVENQALLDYLEWIDSSWNGIVLYYRGNLSEHLVSWLSKSSFPVVTIFPDYDGIGIANYARLQKSIPCCKWFWVTGWQEALILFGNPSLWQTEEHRNQADKFFSHWESNGYPDPQLKELIQLMRTEGKMLEQEWVLV